MRITSVSALLLLFAPIAFMLAFFVIPFVSIAFVSVHGPEPGWTLEYYRMVLGDAYTWSTLWLTIRISVIVVFVALLIGYPLAYYMVKYVRRPSLRRFCYIIAVAPLFTSNIVRAFGWMVLLGRDGLINNTMVSIGLIDKPVRILFTETSIIIGLVYVLTPFMVLSIAAVLQNVDDILREAATDLGANGPITFVKIVFPLSMPGVISGSLIVFALSASAYVTPAVMSGGRIQTSSMEIYNFYMNTFDFHRGAVLAITLLLVTLLISAGFQYIFETRWNSRRWA